MSRFSRLLPLRRYEQTTQGVSTPSRRLGMREWILSRGLCAYQLFDLADIPANERRNALAVKLQQWSPFRVTGNCYVWQGAAVHVWAWDREKVDKAMRQASVVTARIIPDSLLYPLPPVDGTRLLRTIEGYEGQHWSGKRLLQSHWWPALPTAAQWARFLRSCSVAPAKGLPMIDEPALMDDPWGRIQRESHVDTARVNRNVVAIAMSLVMAWLAWQAGGLWRWSEAVASVQSDVDRLTSELDPILANETAARAGLQWLEAISGLHSDIKQIQLLHDVFFNVQSSSPIKLLNWEYANGDLKVTLTGGDLDPSDLVDAYESVRHFSDVSARTGFFPNSMEISMKVVEVRP